MLLKSSKNAKNLFKYVILCRIQKFLKSNIFFNDSKDEKSEKPLFLLIKDQIHFLHLYEKKLRSNHKQGRMPVYPSCMRVGRGSDRKGHWGIWAWAVSSKLSISSSGETFLFMVVDWYFLLRRSKIDARNKKGKIAIIAIAVILEIAK